MNNNYSDEELISLARTNVKNKFFYDLLFRYLKIYPIIVNSVALKLNLYCRDTDEYLLTFYLSFVNAFKSYQEKKGKFRTYFSLIMQRNITKELLKGHYSSDALDHSISLNDSFNNGIEKLECIENKNEVTPEYYYEQNEQTLSLRSESDFNELNLQQKVISLKCSGYTYQQIAKILNISYSKARRLAISKNNIKFKDINVKF